MPGRRNIDRPAEAGQHACVAWPVGHYHMLPGHARPCKIRSPPPPLVHTVLFTDGDRFPAPPAHAPLVRCVTRDALCRARAPAARGLQPMPCRCLARWLAPTTNSRLARVLHCYTRSEERWAARGTTEWRVRAHAVACTVKRADLVHGKGNARCALRGTTGILERKGNDNGGD